MKGKTVLWHNYWLTAEYLIIDVLPMHTQSACWVETANDVTFVSWVIVMVNTCTHTVLMLYTPYVIVDYEELRVWYTDLGYKWCGYDNILWLWQYFVLLLLLSYDWRTYSSSNSGMFSSVITMTGIWVYLIELSMQIWSLFLHSSEWWFEAFKRVTFKFQQHIWSSGGLHQWTVGDCV